VFHSFVHYGERVIVDMWQTFHIPCLTDRRLMDNCNKEVNKEGLQKLAGQCNASRVRFRSDYV